MSVFSRVLLAGLVCASVAGVQAAPTVARAQAAAPSGADDASKDTRGRFFHASKCVMSLGLTSGCDKDAPVRPASRRADAPPAAPDTGTKSRFLQAAKCVTSMGFRQGCNRDEPSGSPSASVRRADAAPAAPDTSTRGQFFHASKCVMSLGFAGDCNKDH